jgi:hypothetical protein
MQSISTIGLKLTPRGWISSRRPAPNEPGARPESLASQNATKAGLVIKQAVYGSATLGGRTPRPRSLLDL